MAEREVAPTFTELDYIANELYQAECWALKRSPGVRWWCLRNNKRDHWRREARSRFLQWSEAERVMWDKRETL